ncbi:34140_t:CDS:2 [Gigaspora margarita]|uniref:34140_t:CDS:1 n=1 Tax=Gigaspora margarita TaxID=4874 RepID=A0ABM8W4X5_GIGMA|nr:34140_t:CDS:2 [Gigaspora margarita]
MLEMLYYDLQPRLSKILEKSPKANDQNLFEDSINSESTNIDLFEEEFNEEFLQINVEATNMGNITKDNSVNSQRPIDSTNKDWSVDDIFFQYNTILK